MKRRAAGSLGTAVLLFVGVIGVGVTSVGAVPLAGGTWGSAIRLVPDSGQGIFHRDAVTDVACPAPSACSAGGFYLDASGHPQAFVANQTGGAQWLAPEEVPGTGALDVGGDARVVALSCGAAGDCTVVGSIETSATTTRAFVDSEVAGTWGDAALVSGTGSIPAASIALDELSCVAAGDCVAAGSYLSGSSKDREALVLQESGGIWGAAAELLGTGPLNSRATPDNNGAQVTSLSCPSIGACAVAGIYQDSHGQQVFVASESSGTWHGASQLGGIAALKRGGGADAVSLSCAVAGECVAGGFASTSLGQVAFVAQESSGTWSAATAVPHLTMLEGKSAAPPQASVTSVACPAAGDCTVAGIFFAGVTAAAFVDGEASGAWRPAEVVPGTSGGEATALSCPQPGDCSVVGGFLSSTTSRFTFDTVANEVHGTWEPATSVAGAELSTSLLTSVACAAPGDCAAGGYSGTNSATDAVVIDETPSAAPGLTSVAPAVGGSNGGTVVVVHGRNLADTVAVRFGSRFGTKLVVLNADALRVTAPPGVGTVSVSIDAESGTSPASVAGRFVYLPSPVVDRLAPATGTTRGGTVVIVHGRGLTGADAVDFGTRAGSHVRVINADAIRVEAPAGTGTVEVRVTTGNGTSAVTVRDRFRYR